MSTTLPGFCPAAGLRAPRFLRRLLAAAWLAVGLAAVAPAQTVPALTVANETPNNYNCDVYRWYDSAGQQRTAALSRNNAADPGGSRGGVLYQYRFFPGGGTTERIITGTGAHGAYNGFGYVVNHHNNDAFVSNLTTGTYNKVFTGRHHAIHQFKLTYPINGINVTATIHWYFATGQDNPVYAITFDTSAAGAGGFPAETMDSRAPYGDMQFGGDGSNPNVSGVAWGDKYKFFSRDEPVTPQSRWDYTQPNTVPYTQMWITSPDAEMGAVQTLNWLQHNTGGSWFQSNWGQTSETRVVGDGSTFGAWMMPTNWQWPYQLNQYEMMDNTSPTGSKRCAWGLMFGAVGSTSYNGYGYENTYSGHPYQSYSVATVIGQHSTSAVQAQVARTERILAATLTATTGTLVTAGPGGIGRIDTVAYPKSGYNAIYGAYELTASAAGAFSTTLNTTGAVKNPTFIIRGMGGVPVTISLDGTALVADQGYFASYDAATQSVWLTIATNWTGSHVLASGAGVPPAVSVSVSPTTATVGRSVSTTITATVSFAANTAVTWSVVEAGGGTVSAAGAYTAPTTLGTYHVRATSVADATKTADAAITVVAPTVSASPSAMALVPGGKTTFTASVTNALNPPVTWSVVEAGGGTVLSTGAYTAPTTAGTYHVRATSVADATRTADASVTVAMASPVITSFQAAPATITSGQSSTLSWTVTGATSLSINQNVGTVSGTSKVVSPTATTIYTLTATGPGGTATATTGVAVGAATTNYTWIYHNALVSPWVAEGGWSATVNLAATPVSHASATKTAEIKIPNAWTGFCLADVTGGSNVTYHSLSTVKSIEFDVYVETDSTNFESVLFVLGADANTVSSPSLASLLPSGWTKAKWYHVAITLASLNPTFNDFYRFVFFKMSDTGNPHFRLADVRYGIVADNLPPNITLGTTVVDYNQLTLPFTTSEAATYKIDYGYGSYSQTFTGPTTTATSHSAVLTGLTRGAALQFRIVATDPSGNAATLTGSVTITDPPPPTTATVTIAVDAANTHPISPWIYGGNFYQDWASKARNLTIDRMGGNRWTAYNWENNASNSGADWGPYSNDNYLGGGTTPAEAVRSVIAADRTRGNASIFTVQMQGYVSADTNGLVTINYPSHLASRFKQVVFKKPIATAGAFTTTPSTTDASVYMDEFVWALNQKIPGLYTDPVNPTFLILDNEPELWPSTHPEIQQTPITVADYLAKTIALTKAIKDVAPGAKTFGPVHYGYNGILNWQNTTSYTFSSSYWFTDKYLDDMKAASTADGRRLLDVYNFHWYSEAQGDGTRVIALIGPTLTDTQIQAIVQSPRSLWDPTYTEDSWVAQSLGGPVRIVARLQEKIAARWPGTGLAITEWANGGGNHIAGAIAVADNLGVFGQQNLFMASMWPDGAATNHSFDYAGFKMYRDFDGALGTFGDICLPTVSSNTSKVSAYVSRDSVIPGRHVIVAINRSNTAQTVGFTGLNLAGTARLFRMTGASTTPSAAGTATVDLANWLLSLPAYTITTVEITSAAPAANYAAWRAANFTGPGLTNDAISGPAADPDGVGLSNFARYAFDFDPRGPVSAPATLGSVAAGGQTYLTLTFDRRAVATDLSYVVESSSDLVAWTTVATYAPSTDIHVTAQDSLALGAATRRFLRVRVTTP